MRRGGTKTGVVPNIPPEMGRKTQAILGGEIPGAEGAIQRKRCMSLDAATKRTLVCLSDLLSQVSKDNYWFAIPDSLTDVSCSDPDATWNAVLTRRDTCRTKWSN